MQVCLWGVVTFLALGVLTAITRMHRFVVLAVLHDMLPVSLAAAWVVLVVALLTRAWIVAILAALLGVYHVAILIPRLVADRAPAWIASASQLSVAVANVFVGNRMPVQSVAQLIAVGPDLLVLTERNEAFVAEFARTGAAVTYHHAIDVPSMRPDYEIAIASRIAMSAESRVIEDGTLRIVHATVRCGVRDLDVVAVHLTALLEPRGYRSWRAEMTALGKYVAALEPPFAIVGDFNATTFRPGFTRPLQQAGARDGHRTAGKGLTRSLRFRAHGLLAVLPAMARVDHVFVSRDVHVVSVANLPASGSDHHPFVATLAVRSDG